MNIFSHVRDLQINKADKWHINSLEAQIQSLQQLIIQAGLVEEYVPPLEQGKSIFRLDNKYYKVKKGK